MKRPTSVPRTPVPSSAGCSQHSVETARSPGSADLEGLADLSLADLRQLWAKRMGRARMPAQKKLIVRDLAWRAQERIHGGLDAETQRLLQRAMREAMKREASQAGAEQDDNEPSERTPKRRALGSASRVVADAAELPSGARLTRVWRGTRHEVRVLEGAGGFVYRGRTFASLSEIAREITGTRWSGPRFFGLTMRTRAGGQ